MKRVNTAKENLVDKDFKSNPVKKDDKNVKKNVNYIIPKDKKVVSNPKKG